MFARPLFVLVAVLLLCPKPRAAPGVHADVRQKPGNDPASFVASADSGRLVQTITFNAPQEIAVSLNPRLVLSATASSGLTVSFSLVSGPATLVPGPESTATRTLIFTGVGAVTVRATQGGDETYAAADVERTIVVTPPANDNFDHALRLVSGAAVDFGLNRWCSLEAAERAHVAGRTGGASVWWVWTAPYSADVVVETRDSDFDTLLAAYTGVSLSTLTAVAANDDTSLGIASSSIRFMATVGTTYYFVVDGRDGATGSIKLSLGAIPSSGRAPTIDMPPDGVSTTAGADASFTVAYSGKFPVVLYWQRLPAGATDWELLVEGGAYRGVGSMLLQVAVTSAMSGDRFRCIATNDLGTATSAAATLSVSTNFGEWSQGHFTAGELLDPLLSGAAADPDGDGLSNLLEYALGADPHTDSSASAPTLSLSDSAWTFTFARPTDRNDLSYTVESSIDLNTWSSAGVTHTRVSTSNGIETWCATYPAGSAPDCFLRLKVTR